uniref:5'-tyrosyl DNA phosphodiesterase n=1 Tax=Mimivirus LCMiAC01 TaxID=2506608 RepID=A0A481Z0Y9_9VIRU|nr:MAG: 5'-tyrosyl DNA phosphodiesterase [Mimivirus LCMiAC01]
MPSKPYAVLITWNILHRYHEEKYAPGSIILKNYPIEVKRNKKILAIIKKLVRKYNKRLILCMQEVNGDLLNMLYHKFFKKYYIVTYQHNRTPKKKGTKNIYNDPREYLVTMISRSFGAYTYDSYQYKKKGKALLVTKLNKLTIINTHIAPPFTFKSGKDDFINIVIKKYVYSKYDKKKVVVTGDFNRTMIQAYKQMYYARKLKNLSCFVDTQHMKPKSVEIRNKSYDHILGFNGVYFDHSRIARVKLASDHNVVITYVFIKQHKNKPAVKKCKETKEMFKKYIK